jgi:flagellin-like hook-associated protein FlgL
MSDIVLSKGIRNNLLQLQRTADNVSLTQGRLATGKKVNSALDNPTNFFTASSLNGRATDLSNLLDGLSNGIKVLEAADNGLKSITKTIESLQSTVRQARQDRTFKTSSYTYSPTSITSAQNLTFSGGQVGSATTVGIQQEVYTGTAATAVGATGGGDLDITIGSGSPITVTIPNSATTDQIVAAINDKLDSQTGGDLGVTASNSGGTLVIKSAHGTAVTFADNATSGNGISASLGFTSPTNTQTGKTLDTLVDDINNTPGLTGKIRATVDNNKLRIENLSTADLTIAGISAAGVDGSATTQSIGPNDVRRNLVTQFNDLRNQLDKFTDDAHFNGVNLLRGDRLKLFLNENSTSTLEIQAKDNQGNVREITNNKLGIVAATDQEFENDGALDSRLDQLKTALDTIRAQASNFGSNLSIVENRQDFTKATINTLKTGADNLTLADMNEESANLLALQTRQQLSQTALSLANQADQGVLRLFG